MINDRMTMKRTQNHSIFGCFIKIHFETHSVVRKSLINRRIIDSLNILQARRWIIKYGNGIDIETVTNGNHLITFIIAQIFINKFVIKFGFFSTTNPKSLNSKNAFFWSQLIYSIITAVARDFSLEYIAGIRKYLLSPGLTSSSSPQLLPKTPLSFA